MHVATWPVGVLTYACMLSHPGIDDYSLTVKNDLLMFLAM